MIKHRWFKEEVYPPLLKMILDSWEGIDLYEDVMDILNDKIGDIIRNEFWFKIVPQPWLTVLHVIDTLQDFWFWMTAEEYERLDRMFYDIAWLGLLYAILKKYRWLHG